MARSRYYLDAVITMIDAKHILRHLEYDGPWAFARRRPEAERQLALADRVIINKAALPTQPATGEHHNDHHRACFVRWIS